MPSFPTLSGLNKMTGMIAHWRNIPWLPLGAAFFLSWSAIAPADEIRLITGEVLVGTIIEQNDGHLILDHPILGRLTIAASKLSPPPSPPSPPSPSSPSSPAPSLPAPTTLTKADSSAPQAVPQTIAAWAPAVLPDDSGQSANFLQDWHAKLELGLNGSQGNSVSSDFFVGLSADKKNRQDRWDFRSRYRMSRSNLETTRNNAIADLRRDWLLPESPWFIFMQARYEYDEFQSWNHRVESLVGPGYDLFNQPNLLWNVRLGFGAEKRFGDADDTTRPESGLSSDIDWEINAVHRLQSSLNYYQDLKDDQAYRFVGRVAWLILMDQANGLSLKLSLEDEYDAKPKGDSLRNDLRYMASIVWEF